jgi:hypothetical protein
VQRALTHLTHGPSSVHTLAFARSIQPTLTSQPLQLYAVQLRDITDENFPAKASPVGWRYLIVRGEPVAFADVKHSADDSAALAFSRLTHGAAVQRLAQAAELADQAYSNSADAFECRILEIPALYEAALWLHGPRDVFIPFVSATPAEGPPREDAQFVQRMVTQARERQEPTGEAMGP